MKFQLDDRVSHKESGKTGQIAMRFKRVPENHYIVLWDDESASRVQESKLDPEGQTRLLG